MAKYTGMILTNKGKELLARAIIAQELITFTKAEIGNGDLLPEELPEELTGLKGSFKVLNITSTTVLEDGAFRVRVAFDNAGIVSDTYLKEIGVFARGEDGIEVLYSYCNTDDPDLIPGEGSGVIERIEDLITYISNATTINAIIDQSNVYATIKDLTDGLDTKENKFTKNSGFNRVKSDSVSLDDTNTLGTSKAVKIAYDKGIEAKNTADGKEPAFLKNSGFNKNFGNQSGTVAEGNHSHSASEVGALSLVASDLSSIGYRHTSDGFIEQWGFAEIASDQLLTVNFPIAFPTECLNLVVSWKSTTGTDYWSPKGDLISPSQCYIKNSTGSSISVFWRAIGQ